MNGSKMDRRNFLHRSGTGLAAVAAAGLRPDWLGAHESARGDGVFEHGFGVSAGDMKKILGVALSKGGKFAELFFEYRISNSLRMEEDIIKDSSRSIGLGMGVRVVAGEQTGYGYTNDLTLEKMKKTALTAAAIAAGRPFAGSADLRETKPSLDVYDRTEPVESLALQAKIALVKDAYDAALRYDPRIRKVQSSLADEIQFVTIANSEGLLVSDARPQVRLSVRATAEEGGKRNTGSGNSGGRVGLSHFRNVMTPEKIGRKAAEEAVLLLSAVDPPAGEQPVVLGAEQSGVMTHEAVGHPLEADANRKKTSIMWDKMGQLVANPIVTIFDDPTLSGLRGSLNVDDEGTTPVRTALIEKGKLVGYLQDRISAVTMGVPMNGHGRRESYENIPIPRMCNTVLERGEHDPDEIIRSVKKGFYALTYQGGQVQDSGKFTFSVNMGYLIEDGRLTRPVKNATLIGTNVQILNEVEMIGNDMGFFLGTCGKDGQSAAVTSGTPTLKLRRMTVGGRL
jgi:TldD protein